MQPDSEPQESRVAGRATRAGTARYAERFASLPGHFRRPDELTLSSLALGTRRGTAGGVDDLLLRSAVAECLERGVNVIDTALSDRMQTSERAVGIALRRALVEGVVARDEVVVVTKGGRLTPDPARARDYRSAQADLRTSYIESGLVDLEESVSGFCIGPAFLQDQIRRSRANLGLETLDVYLIEEPETHLKPLGPQKFRDALAACFETLEEEVRTGHIGAYGLSTWEGFLLPDSDRSHLSLLDVLELALDVGGADHHLRVLQLPYGLALGEGAVLSNQLGPDGRCRALLESLSGTGTAVLASAPLYGGRLVGRVPDWVRDALPETHGDAQCALQFVRSTENITSAVVGMRDPVHLDDNLALTRVRPAEARTPAALFARAMAGA